MHDVLIRCIGTHIYRLHGGAATSSNIQERRGPSVNIQDTYVPYNIYSTVETQLRHCTIDVDETQRAPRPHNAATPSVSWVWPKGSPRPSRRHGACLPPTGVKGHHNAQTRRRALSHGAPALDTPKSSDQDLTREPSNWQEEATTTIAMTRLALETRPHHGRHLQNHGAHQLRWTSVL
jgi:hypothetical protein